MPSTLLLGKNAKYHAAYSNSRSTHEIISKHASVQQSQCIAHLLKIHYEPVRASFDFLAYLTVTWRAAKLCLEILSISSLRTMFHLDSSKSDECIGSSVNITGFHISRAITDHNDRGVSMLRL